MLLDACKFFISHNYASALVYFLCVDLDDTMTNERIAESFNLAPPFSIEEFSYSNDELLEVIFEHIENISFDGITV